MRRVTIWKRWNKGDGSCALYLRYTDPLTRRDERELVYRTEPRAGVRTMRRAMGIARDLAAEKRRELLADGATRLEQIGLEDGRDAYLLWCQSLGPNGMERRARVTVSNNERNITAFLGQLAAEQRVTVGMMHQIRRTHVARWRDWLAGRGLSAGTVNNMVASVSAWLAWGEDHGHIHANPCRRILYERVGNRRANPPITGPDELVRLQDKMPDRHRADVVLLLACTGLRQGEFGDMTWECWKEGESLLEVPEGRETTKRHARRIPLTTQATEALRRLRAESEGGPYIAGARKGYNKLTSQVNKWLKPCGVKPHDLRRFFVTALETIGAPKSVIDDLAGHSPGKVRAAYTPTDNLAVARRWIAVFAKWLAGSAAR